jgi:hypothetical protein
MAAAPKQQSISDEESDEEGNLSATNVNNFSGGIEAD